MRIREVNPILGIALAIAGCDPRWPQAKSPDHPAPATTASEMPTIGRYQIVVSPHLRADTFLLDTQKGRVWKITKYVDLPDAPAVFSEMDIIDHKGEIGIQISEFIERNKPEGPSEQKGKSAPRSSTLEGGRATPSEPAPGKR